MIRYIYTFFVGLFVAIFVGMGVAVFYAPPEAPEPPSWYDTYQVEKQPTTVERESEKEFLAKQKIYDNEMKLYNRNVSIIVIVCSVAILCIALVFSERLGVIADGLLLGGVFTLLYGVGRGLSTDNNKYRFLVATTSLIIVLLLGYVKFLRQNTAGVHINKVGAKDHDQVL